MKRISIESMVVSLGWEMRTPKEFRFHSGYSEWLGNLYLVYSQFNNN